MPKPLAATLRDVADRIDKLRDGRRLNESATKASLISPVLDALGWDVTDVDEVHLEFKPRRRDNPVDYALVEAGVPKLFVEAKALGQRLDDRKWESQVLSYATVAGVQWVVLTNGREYRIYNAHAPVAVEGKLFRTLDLVTAPEAAADTLRLISKESLRGNDLEALWRAHFVDGQVRAAMENAFGSEADPAVVRLLMKLTKSLTQGDIRASLRRMRMQLEFPHELAALGAKKTPVSKKPKPETGETKRKTAAKPARAAQAAVSIGDLIAAGHLTPGATLVKTFKGAALEATVLQDGTIRFDGQVFDSPSSAGAAARAAVLKLKPSAKHPATNGWDFWFVRGEESAGHVRLADLRTRLMELKPATKSTRLRVVGDE